MTSRPTDPEIQNAIFHTARDLASGKVTRDASLATPTEHLNAAGHELPKPLIRKHATWIHAVAAAWLHQTDTPRDEAAEILGTTPEHTRTLAARGNEFLNLFVMPPRLKETQP